MEKKYMFNNFSIVVPIYNEEAIFLESATNIYEIALRTKLNFELIFSENGSTDNTKEIVSRFIKNKKECSLISSDKPDYGAALKSGFESAKNEIIISFDIDYYSEDFIETILNLDKKYSAVIASKRLKESDDDRSTTRRLISRCFVIMLKLFFGTNLSDTHGMKAIKSESLHQHLSKVISNQWMFDTELLMRIEAGGGLIKEVPIIVKEIRPSVYSISGDIPKTVYLMIKLRVKMLQEKIKRN
jgi:glycosyltransferase involved in cell wall biosynthesis